MFHKNVSIPGGRGVRLGRNPARWVWSFSNSPWKPSIPTAMKERTEVHGFFKQDSAGVSNGVRIKSGGAAPEGRVCLRWEIRFGLLEWGHRVTRLAAGGMLSGLGRKKTPEKFLQRLPDIMRPAYLLARRA